MAKLKVYMTESWYTWRCTDSIEIDTNDYEELKGLSEEEVYEHLEENLWEFEVKKEEGDKYTMTLADHLQEQDWIREKIKNEEFNLHRE